MNILLVTPELPPSPRSAGIGSYTLDLARGLKHELHNVIILTPSEDRSREQTITDDGIQIYKIKGGDFFIGDSFFAKIKNRVRKVLFYNSFRRNISRKIQKLCEDHDIDIVEIPEYGNLGENWIKKPHCQTVMRFHGPSFLDREQARLQVRSTTDVRELRTIQLAKAHSYVSNALGYLVTPFLTDNTQIRETIHNSINLPTQMPNEENFPDNKYFRVLGVGSIGRIKGWDNLYDACNVLAASGVKIDLTICGRPADLFHELQQKYKQDKSENFLFSMPGQLRREQLLDMYNDFNLCCFPSQFEPCGLTALEAMSQGGLVLASSLGGWSEIIKNGVNGYLVDPNMGSAHLSNKILKLLRMELEITNEIRKNAKNTIKSDLNYNSFIKQTVSLYNKVLECK